MRASHAILDVLFGMLPVWHVADTLDKSSSTLPAPFGVCPFIAAVATVVSLRGDGLLPAL